MNSSDINSDSLVENQVERRISQLNKIDQDIISLLETGVEHKSIEKIKDIVENIKEEIKLLENK